MTAARLIRLGSVLIAVQVIGLAAIAQTRVQPPEQTPAASAAPAACPHRPVSVYFASGDVMTSPQARTLVSRLGELAEACAPDRVDLVAHVDTVSEGAEALTLALARLSEVARNLVADGVAADRLRIVAQPSAGAPAGLHQVDVVFHRADGIAPPADIAREPPPRILTKRSNPV